MPGADRPIRVLHLLLASESGGLSRYTLDLCAALTAQGHEMIVAGDRGAWHDRFAGQGFPYVEIPLKRGLRGFWRSRAMIRRLLRDRPVDVIHTHYRRATLLARAVGRGAPVLYTLHLSHINVGFPRNLLSDFGDHTHVASDDAGQWLESVAHCPANRITCIPHGVRIERFPMKDAQSRAAARRALDLRETDRVAAFVGRLEDPKNEGWLLDLAAASRAQLPDLRVVLAGDGPNAAPVRDRVDAENLHDRVKLLGEIDPLPLYQAADALLLPSAREGFSYVCAEAMSVGVPVLRTRTSGTSATVVEGVTGRSTSIDHDAFIAAAIDFLADPAALARMGRAAAEHVRRNLSFEQQVARTLDLYRRLARMSGGDR